MRYLILSDIHANWEALQAVLADAEGKYDKILCCGDIVGYGANPNEVTEWVRTNVALCVRGNHDKAAAGLENLEWFNPFARDSALWTQKITTQENLTYLRLLERGPLRFGNMQILHGSPVDEDEYLVGRDDAEQVAYYLDVPYSFFGHTHLQGGFACHRNGVRLIQRPALNESHREVGLEPGMNYLFNAGSVGQPRDADPRAAYALYTVGEPLLVLRRTPYDIAAAQKKIVAAGLPEFLAERLAAGR